ncbi:MAG: YbaY family lipoprotein [Shewanella sp.]|nr:YbaY family lipoprotein [Shewanella sp.]MCF1429964.1 YbaY family lipoprotein [Shewanella sp.]MCF1437683.1 YbaY family lipoprotein [Shewanella sp.]MCF1459361.1 YbaY family lipoprotein [Shewanella sp.]
MNKWIKFIAAPLVLVSGLMSGCATQNATVDIYGEVWYRERIALPPDAVLTVQLKDVSRLDAPAEVIAEMVRDDVSTPATFSFVMARDQLEPGHTYAIGARITLGDQLLFINTQAYNVDLNASEPMSVLLNKVGR